MNGDVFRGTIPALMTPCDARGQVDLAELVRTGVRLMEAGMSAVVYCGSMGDWPLLSDEQRMAGVEALVRAGVPVVVGTGAQSPARAAALAAHARKTGAAGLMVIPRVLSRGVSQAAQRAHFAAVLEAGDGLPAVIYNSPYYGFQTRADLFFALREAYPHLVGFKEFGGAESLRYAAEHITSRDDSVMLVVGVDTQAYHGFVNCGASGAITGIGNTLPGAVLELVALCRKAAAGDAVARRRAKELDEAMQVLSSFDEGVDLVLFYKHLMVLEGHDAYRHQLQPTDVLSPSQRHYAETQWRLFKAWHAAWKAA
jgi:4-hydroxy-tetrahydrodipicolinate synthase